MKDLTINEERKLLLEKADAYLAEWEEARINLEFKSKNFLKNAALIVVIGLSIYYLYQLIGGSDNNSSKSRSLGRSSRFGKAISALLVPLLIKNLKKIIFSNHDEESEEK